MWDSHLDGAPAVQIVEFAREPEMFPPIALVLVHAVALAMPEAVP